MRISDWSSDVFSSDLDVEEESSDDEEDSMTERRAKRPVDDEEEDNTISLAQMEETLKPQALEKFANITAIYKKFSKMEAARLDAMAAGREMPAAEERKNKTQSEETTAEVGRKSERKGKRGEERVEW